MKAKIETSEAYGILGAVALAASTCYTARDFTSHWFAVVVTDALVLLGGVLAFQAGWSGSDISWRNATQHARKERDAALLLYRSAKRNRCADLDVHWRYEEVVAELDTARTALRNIVNVLGPSTCGCHAEGCALDVEAAAAIEYAVAVVGREPSSTDDSTPLRRADELADVKAENERLKAANEALQESVPDGDLYTVAVEWETCAKQLATERDHLRAKLDYTEALLEKWQSGFREVSAALRSERAAIQRVRDLAQQWVDEDGDEFCAAEPLRRVLDGKDLS